jgi:hypothetical protein
VRLGAVIDRAGPDERAALVAAGVTELRIAVRWAQLQPRAGHWDAEALEALATEVAEAADAGLAPWLALLGRRVPGWFDDEGGFTDAKTASRWWPRYLDGVAGRLGDAVAGWFPMVNPAGFAAAAFSGRAPDVAYAGRRALVVAWRDAWRILHGRSPVVAALAVEPWSDEWPRLLRTGEPTYAGLELDDLAGSCNLLGGIVTVGPQTSVEETTERLVRLAAEGPERPLAVLVNLDGGVDGTDEADEVRAKAAERAAAAIRATTDDGVTVDCVFADSLLGSDGGPAPAAAQLRLR